MGDVYRTFAVFEDTALGQVYTTHLDLERDVASILPPPIADVGDAWKAAWDVGYGAGAALKSLYTADTRLNAIQMRRIKPLEAVVQEYTTGLPIVGTAVGDKMAPQVAILGSLRTGKVGRRFRGRMYLPAPYEGAEESTGAMSAATASDVADTLWGLVLALDVPTEYSPVVFSELEAAGAGEGEIITKVLVDRRFRTIRKRAIENTLYVQGA